MKFIVLLVFVISIYSKLYSQKRIYIPKEHKAGINDTSSKYCFDRSFQTANFIFLWQKGVKPDTTAFKSCENMYRYYVDTMKFASLKANANINKYKIIVMIDPNIGYAAYGSGVDDFIGAMWVGPGSMGGFVFAHELGHCFSFMAHVDGKPHYGFQDLPGKEKSRIYCGPFWETTANYMAFQLRSYQSEANRDIGDYMRCYNYFFTHARHRYEGWPMLEALKMELGIDFLAKTWLQSKDPEHPIETIKRLFCNNDQSQVNDLFAKGAMRIINWDISEPLATQIKDFVKSKSNSSFPLKFQTILRPLNIEKGRYAVSDNFAPQEYGYNAIKLFPQKNINGNTLVYIHFRGIKANDNAGWRYGFVAKKSNGSVIYGKIYKNDKEIVSFTADSTITELYFVVMGAPTRHTNYTWEVGFPKIYRYKYEIAVKNAIPEGYEADFRKPKNIAGHPHSNGGGFVASTANVDNSVYVGPNAKILDTATITGNVRIEDWAVIADKATISGNVVVKGHAFIEGKAKISDTVIVSDESHVSGNAIISGKAQILNHATIVGGTISGSAIIKGNAFEWKQTIGGTVVLGGDNENTSANSGVFLQMPDYNNNGRKADDGLGESDPSNVDVNTIPVSYASEADMDFPEEISAFQK